MGTSVPNWKNELSSRGQGDVKTYTLSPEELAKIVGKPIPKSHTKPLTFRAKTKTIKEEKPTMKTASKDDPKPAAPVKEVAAETPKSVAQPEEESYKPVLTKAEDEAIKYLLVGWGKQELLQEHAKSPLGWRSGTPAEALNGMSIWLLAQALIAGYTVELTPEETLIEKYADSYNVDSAYNEGWRKGVRSALNAMGKSIEGITN
ncbi:hypothetical protein [Paenibacillus polymyxa]|jgi:hypothetical protein|uniref:hypothetical protein n=1 Tax=Paenibacillus polymyxa TaxID=1406 RepID=UPI00083D1189|nr:hypothetical protein [Paenibacillus polymyxa]ODB61401.1 hypothetical protein A7309_15260 [Paenibacillus polymyxa]